MVSLPQCNQYSMYKNNTRNNPHIGSWTRVIMYTCKRIPMWTSLEFWHSLTLMRSASDCAGVCALQTCHTKWRQDDKKHCSGAPIISCLFTKYVARCEADLIKKMTIATFSSEIFPRLISSILSVNMTIYRTISLTYAMFTIMKTYWKDPYFCDPWQ